ncbi:MAG: shikimate kinase, partial [Firmicutes bacterium]|nr:shikimate kinase [Bacillota bacterium]
MMKCGLLGEKLSHSYSPEIHALLGDYSYELFEKTPGETEVFLRHGDFDCLNVGIPYKKTAAALCDALSLIARRLGNVNTVVARTDADGRRTLYGDNTDYAGFLALVRKSRVRVEGCKCLVLGSGGASLSVQTVLKDLGATEVVVISRSGADIYENLERHAD